MRTLIFAALLVLTTMGVSAQAPTVTLTTMLAWDQPAADLATAACCHKLYVDTAATGTPLAGVVCTGSASPFTCTAPAPILPSGAHTLAVTHVTSYGETAKSAALSVVVLGAGVVPANMRVVPPPPPPSQTVTLAPSGDTTLNVDIPVVHAADTTLNLYTMPAATVANTILMKFDVSSIPSTATVQTATLSLTLVQSDTFPEPTYTVTASRICQCPGTANPVVALATGALYDGVNPWRAVPGRTVPMALYDISPPEDSEVLDKTLNVKTWTITKMVQAWVNGGAPNLGVLLNSDPTALSDRYRYFASSENATVASRPSLKVTYTP